ncbi:MAG: thioredoxin domain-containing protein [Euryarchaeota archaeon]|nr:thioredoxin domain-containing protein [Euryarchaeota archaeon]
MSTMTRRHVSTISSELNRLADERSPYLLQHAENPVDWYPWGDEAFQRAKEEDKPVFLSIGYSSCHWCHVMADESFQDDDVALLLNENFISVKVDREERPDIDSTYMMAAQLMSGTGGWPLTIMMTPDKRPFFAATYLPKYSKQGMTGLTEIIPIISQAWRERRDEIVEASERIIEAVRMSKQPTPAGRVGIESLIEGYEGLKKSYDTRYGGFGRAPKFPLPHRLMFLMRYWDRTGEPYALEMVNHTLKEMRRGGIFDQLGGGFHRYSTDRNWKVPHFEKMLYDQALLLMTYVEAWKIFGEEEFQNTAIDIIDYVLERLTSPEGGFYSAEDADSEGVEGKYYLWNEDELSSFLDSEELAEARRIFGITASGNMKINGYEQGNVLKLENEITDSFEQIKRKMLRHRNERSAPFLDDKIMADWNGLMIVGLAKAYGAWREPRHGDAARNAAEFVLNNMMTNNQHHHVFRDDSAGGPIFLDDYAFMAWGLLELYFADLDPRWLKASIDMMEYMLADFADPEGGFFQTSEESDPIGRIKEVYDGAIPSGNSIALMVLHTLYTITEREDILNAAEKLEKALSGAVIRSPDAHTQFLNAVDLSMGPITSIVLTGESVDVEPFLTEIGKSFIPRKVVLNNSKDAGLEEASPLLRGKIATEVAAYICKEHTCLPRVTDIPSFRRLLNS